MPALALLWNNIDIFQVKTPWAFVQAAAYYAEKNLCDNVVKGSDFPNWVIGKNADAPTWLSEKSGMGPQYDFEVLFSELPVNDDEYYLVGQYTINIPGIDDIPELPSQIEIASAINFCEGDYLFAFNGFEITPTIGPMAGSAALSTASFSYYFRINTADMGIDTNFWTPWGTKDFFMYGDISMSGDISFGINIGDYVYIELSDSSAFILNSDPYGGGYFTPDFATAFSIDMAPLVTLFDTVTFDFTPVTFKDGAVYASFKDMDQYILALRLDVESSVSEFFTFVPFVGNAITDAINMLIPMQASILSLYVDQDNWYITLGTGLTKTVHFSVLGDVFDQILRYISNFEKQVAPSFMISGPASLLDSGTLALPVKATFTLEGVSVSMYFCDHDGDCPFGSCQLNVCVTLDCKDDYHLIGLLCYQACPSGYTNVLGVCWQNCPSGYTDVGTSCVAESCPSGQQNIAGVCYDNCGSDFQLVGTVCWKRCSSFGSDYDDTGATCTRWPKSYGKSCCCLYYFTCHGFIHCHTKSSCCNNCDSGYDDTGCTCYKSMSVKWKESIWLEPRGIATKIIWKKTILLIPLVPFFSLG